MAIRGRSDAEGDLPLHAYIRQLQEEQEEGLSFTTIFTPATASTTPTSPKSPLSPNRSKVHEDGNGPRQLLNVKRMSLSQHSPGGSPCRSPCRSPCQSPVVRSSSLKSFPTSPLSLSPPSVSPSLSRVGSPLQCDETEAGGEVPPQAPGRLAAVGNLVWSAAKKLARAGSGLSTAPPCSESQFTEEPDEVPDSEDSAPALSRTLSLPQTTGSGQRPTLRKSMTSEPHRQPEERSFSFGLETVKALGKRMSQASSMSIPEDEEDATTFPMYTVPLQTLLEMREALPHEELKAKGMLSVFSRGMGKAAYVSHEWVAQTHPDPKSQQLQVLQGALKNIMSCMKIIPPDAVGEQLFPGHGGIDTAQFRSETLHLWYDYFSCPQLGRDRQHAVSASIPQYIARSDFFFALCPAFESPEGKMLSTHSWAKRGWCRFERTVRELSGGTCILVQGPSTMEVMAQTQVATVYGGPPGEGCFEEEEDKEMVGKLLSEVLWNKLMSCLQAGDVVGYRVDLNLQSILLRGLPAEPIVDLVPAFEPSTEDVVVESFFFQNGFKSVSEVDSAGWTPLCYACLTGDLALVQGLLDQGADPNVQTGKPQPLVNLTAWNSAVSLCAYFKQNAVMRVLMEAKAKFDSGWNPPISAAAVSDNAEAIRILCEAGTSPIAKNSFGITPLECACAAGSLACLNELISQTDGVVDTSRALHFATWYRGGTEEVLSRLIEVGADMNEQLKQSSTSLLGINWSHLSLQYRLGVVTTSTRVAYHSYASTPLMLGVLSGQSAGVLALIKMGVRLDLRNSRNRTAAELAVEVGAPESLIKALEGDQMTAAAETSQQSGRASSKASMLARMQGLVRSLAVPPQQRG